MEFLILWLVCGVITGIVASAKGRSGFGWFLLGCLLGIFGIIFIALMPSLKPMPVAALSAVPHAAIEATKRCPDCGETVLAVAKICKHCRHNFASEGQNR